MAEHPAQGMPGQVALCPEAMQHVAPSILDKSHLHLASGLDDVDSLSSTALPGAHTDWSNDVGAKITCYMKE